MPMTYCDLCEENFTEPGHFCIACETFVCPACAEKGTTCDDCERFFCEPCAETEIQHDSTPGLCKPCSDTAIELSREVRDSDMRQPYGERNL